MVHFWRYNHWTHAATVYSSDAYAYTGYTAFALEAGRQNITIIGSAMFARGESQNSASELLARLKASGARFFALFAVYQDTHNVFKAAEALGMTGKGYAWVLSCAAFSIPADEDVYHAWNGSMVFCPSYSKDSAQFRETVMRHLAKPPDADCPGFDPRQNEDPLPQWGAYAYDATMLLARALHRLIYEEGRDPRELQARHRLMDLILNTTFEGVTGKVALSPQGDRLLNSDVYNLHSDQRVRVSGCSINLHAQCKYNMSIPRVPPG